MTFERLVLDSGRLYAMPDREDGFPRAVTPEEAAALNAHGPTGVFWCANPLRGRRQLSNCTGIEWWVAEMDEGDKSEQLRRLLALPVPPTAVVESRRSLHCYWRAAETEPAARYDAVVRGALVPLLGADARAATATGLYRAPGFWHHKAEPFPVRVAWYQPLVSYTTDGLLRALGERVPARRRREPGLPPRSPAADPLEMLDMGLVIEWLSGHWLQGHKIYSVGPPRRRDGHRQVDLVYPERRKTPLFIVPDGRYFVVGGGGGTVIEWVRYNAKYTPEQSMDVRLAELRRLFASELEEVTDASDRGAPRGTARMGDGRG